MTSRILDLSREPVSLRSRNGLLEIIRPTHEITSFPFGELAAVIASHKQISITHSALADLAEAGGIFICCDDNNRPTGMLLPLDGHTIQGERFRRQAQLSEGVKNRLWAQVVRAKVLQQTRLIIHLQGQDHGLMALTKRVQHGDKTKIEARAARRYWRILFEQSTFRRWNEEDPRSHGLNYGYTILRAIVLRAICGAGLHPSFGIFHRNLHNPFVLADDLMAVYRLAQAENDLSLTTGVKRSLIRAASGKVVVEEQERTMFDVAAKLAQSLAALTMGEEKLLWLPEWSLTAETQ
jgi:CRISP-associated protein Cas1